MIVNNTKLSNYINIVIKLKLDNYPEKTILSLDQIESINYKIIMLSRNLYLLHSLLNGIVRAQGLKNKPNRKNKSFIKNKASRKNIACVLYKSSRAHTLNSY